MKERPQPINAPRATSLNHYHHRGGYDYRPVVVDQQGEYRFVECKGCLSIVLYDDASMMGHSGWHNRNHSMRPDNHTQGDHKGTLAG